MYKNKKIFILGMARSGYEVAKLLATDNEILITDMKEQDNEKIKELEGLGVSFILSNTPEELLDNSFDIMIKNPGIKYDHKCVVKAKNIGISVINEVEVAYHYLDKGVNIIGVTGSNGKTTTTSIIYEIMKKAYGDKVVLAGNIGTPLCHYVKNIKSGDYLVMEISDHQLCDMYDFKTNISVITNIYECHTDFHDSHERYVMTKKKIFNHHTKNDTAIINMDNEEVMNMTKDINSSKLYFSCNNETNCYYKDGFIYLNDNKYIDVSKIILKGLHNYQNIMCAILCAKKYNVSDDIIIDVLTKFSGVEHRLEYVGNINGREVYNDSKSTNTESTVIALNSFDKDTILLMGGLDRGHSFEELKEPMKNTKLVITYGETKNRIKEFCDIDFVVYTAAIKEDNVEMVEAKKKNIPMMERGEFLGEITKLYPNTIGIAGTHGKTSTTSMVSLIFLEADMDPTIQVGSILSNINGNYRIGKSDTLIIEACEYCDSFLSFKQKSAIILNIDNDHLDYFKNLDNIKNSFNKYVSHLPSDGYLVVNNDDKNSNGLKDNTKARVVTYGIINDSDYMATDIKYDNDGCASFNVINNDNNLGRIELSVPGEHNVLNALSAIALASSYDISFEDIKRGIKKYKGASRRLEYKGKFKGADVYDDYGHHPTEIMATSNAIHKKQYNESWVIFEAHTYSRAYKHKEDFAKALKNFDHIIVTDIYAAREENIYGITEDDIVKEIKKYGKEAFHISSYEDIKLYLSQYVHDGDLILTLGAGNVTKVADLLVSKDE